MTSIYYDFTEDGHELFIYGHAGYDGGGNDIVCSAISAIGYALLGFLENEANEESEYAYMTESGKLFIAAAASERVDAAFEMAKIGLMQIEKQYPKFVLFNDMPQQAADLGEETPDDLGERP